MLSHFDTFHTLCHIWRIQIWKWKILLQFLQMWWSCTVRFFYLIKFSVLKIAKFCFPRIRFKRQVDDDSLVVHNQNLTFTQDDQMNMKFDIDLDLNQLLNETQMEDNEFPITVIHTYLSHCLRSLTWIKKSILSRDCYSGQIYAKPEWNSSKLKCFDEPFLRKINFCVLAY